MIKSLTPPNQKFKDLPSSSFFIIAGCSTRLYQKILPITDSNNAVFNAIELKEYPVGQRSRGYYMCLSNITEDFTVTRVEIVDIEITVSPKSVELQ